MPIKWGPQADQKLLLKILQAHPELAINTTKVAELWPEKGDMNRPTARVIQERLRNIKRQAGINTPTRISGSNIEPANNRPAAAIKSKSQKSESEVVGTETPRENLNFIHSSFDTQYRTTQSTTNNQKLTGGRTRQRVDSSEEDAMSTSGSDNESDGPAEESATPPSKSRSSVRRTASTPTYNFRDLQLPGADEDGEDEDDDETNEEANSDSSSSSDGGYDPLKEAEELQAKSDKRTRPFKVARLGSPSHFIDHNDDTCPHPHDWLAGNPHQPFDLCCFRHVTEAYYVEVPEAEFHWK